MIINWIITDFVQYIEVRSAVWKAGRGPIRRDVMLETLFRRYLSFSLLRKSATYLQYLIHNTLQIPLPTLITIPLSYLNADNLKIN
jgi:hypothetical protein